MLQKVVTLRNIIITVSCSFFWSILCLHTSVTFTAETETDSSKFSLNRFTIICKNWHIPSIKAKFPLAISEENRLGECGYLSQPSTFIHLGNYHFIMPSKRACGEIHHWWTKCHWSPPPLVQDQGASSCPHQAFVTVMWQGLWVQNGTSGVSCAVRVNNRSLIQQRPQKQAHGQPDTPTPSRHRGLQPRLASAAQTSDFILKAVYSIRRRGKIKHKKHYSLMNACYSAKIRTASVRLGKFSSSFNSDFRNFVGGSEDLQALPNSEGTKYN